MFRFASGLAALILVMVLGKPALAAETEITAPGPLGALGGVLSEPSGARRGVVLIIPGSGPTNRDGDSPAGVRAGTYRLLSRCLQEAGFSSARIDKRGMFSSAAAVPDPNRVILSDYAVDIRSWISVLKAREAAPCVWLLGHSEGGLVALVAAQDPRDICGVLLASAPGRRLSDVLREQLQANPANAPILPEALSILGELEQGRRVPGDSVSPVLSPLFRPAVQDFLIDAFSKDPAGLIKAVRKPVLILQGERDLQVLPADARQLSAANPTARLVLLDDANHVLKSVDSNDRAANLAAYQNPQLPLAPDVCPAITEFLAGAPDAD
ncbi:MAG: alpha/beta hydrolase [Phenylobacterium sp.]|jgi:pimeloyl-ACP methyl ester carboxylesterase|nr:alpha/beta hydrolase [Phenylobacterium sp.]